MGSSTGLDGIPEAEHGTTDETTKGGEFLDDPQAASISDAAQENGHWDGTEWEKSFIDGHSPDPLPGTDWEKGATGAITVETSAMTATAHAIRSLLPALRENERDIRDMVVRPGAEEFVQAKELADRVMGPDTGVKALTGMFLANAISALELTADKLDKVAKLYDDTEDDRQIDVTRLTKLLGDVRDQLRDVPGLEEAVGDTLLPLSSPPPNAGLPGSGAPGSGAPPTV